MSWTPLAQRLDTLPLVLAGPILRHTDRDSVTVWVALKESATIALEILEPGGVGPLHMARPLAEGTATTLKLGERLHVAAVTARKVGALAWGALYAYNLKFGGGRDLLSPAVLTGGLENPVEISYFAHGLPTFVLPPTELDEVRLAHGSCRKPHNPGRDALSILDLLIEESVDHPDRPDRRPHQLFLTGDQIYAEEVMDPLLFMIMDAVDSLTRWVEPLPNRNQLTDSTQPVKKLRPGTRAEVLQRDASLEFHAATQLQSHVIGLAEYFVMYLFAWSDSLWPETLPPTPEPGASMSHKDWREQVGYLKEFRADIPAVRRVLANIPTYMIFDDHDVTDDWNISKSWCDNVLGTSLGYRLIQNALIAYAIFQHWGNAPDLFEGTDGKALLENAALLVGGDTTKRAALSEYVGLPPDLDIAHRWVTRDGRVLRPAAPGDDEVFLARGVKALRWDYVVTGPKYRVIVLDTRTWRGHRESAAAAKDPPSMLSSEGFRVQLHGPRVKPPIGVELTCVIAPTNPVGIRIIDWVQARAAKHWYSASIGFLDYGDAWNFHDAAFGRLLSSVFAGSRPIVLLSGDIHFGYAVKLSYWAQRPYDPPEGLPAQPQSGVIAQLTASAFKNADGPKKLTKLVHTRAKQLLPERPHEFVVWNEPDHRLLLRRKTGDDEWPEVYPAPGSPVKMELEQGVEYEVPYADRQPDWRYKIKFQGRVQGQPRDAYLLPSMPAVDKAIECLEWYTALGTAHPNPVSSARLLAASPYFQEGKEIVGRHNVGLITFKWPVRPDDTGKFAIQDLYFYPPGFTDEPPTFGHYAISLDPEPDPGPLSVTP
jgi:hypothetical protein